MNSILNPFRDLSPAHRREVARQRQVAFEAKQRQEKVRDAYRELVNTPRYQAIKDDLSASLGELLRELVESASTCAHCAPLAVKVKVMQEIVAEPLHRLYDEADRSRMAPDEIPDVV